MSEEGKTVDVDIKNSRDHAQDVALLGLRRRLQQQRQSASDSNSVVARIRRRNDVALDEIMRKNAEKASNDIVSSPKGDHLGHPSVPLTGYVSQVTPSRSPVETHPPSVPRPHLPRRTYVDEARLHELRRKPKNLSPAAGFHLEPLLPPQEPCVAGRITLILDVDETLVHASFTNAKPFDVRLTVDTETERGYIYVAFRPKLAEFLDFCAQRFEIVFFTASLSAYANQLIDQLDTKGNLGKLRLFREHCTEMRNIRVKDISLLGRPLERVAIIDNSHVAYLFQPRNAIPILSWFDDRRDAEFERLMPMLHELSESENVYDVLDVWNCTVH